MSLQAGEYRGLKRTMHVALSTQDKFQCHGEAPDQDEPLAVLWPRPLDTQHPNCIAGPSQYQCQQIRDRYVR